VDVRVVNSVLINIPKSVLLEGQLIDVIGGVLSDKVAKDKVVQIYSALIISR
jgi:hypothetical protein